MKNKTKYLVIGTALLTATAGSVVAFAGPNYGNHGEDGMSGGGSFEQMQGHMMGYMQGFMQGQMMGNMQGHMMGNKQGNMMGNKQGHMMGNKQGHMMGNKQGKFGHGSGQMGYMQGIYQLDDLSDEQKTQLSELRESQQALMQERRAEMAAQMKGKVDAILTEEQRARLGNMNN